jgi:hypothetical protein
MNTDSDWDRFISSEIEQFLTAFQQIEIDVAPPDAAEPQIVPVHAPYMMQTLAIMDRPDDFARLKKRHRDRLRRVKAAREQAPAAVKQFLAGWFFDANGQERLLAAGRAEVTEIQTLLQAAVRQGLLPLPTGEKVHNGRILRSWLKSYGIGVDCSAFVQQALTHLVNACRTAIGETAVTQRQLGLGFLRCGWVYRDVTTGSRNGDHLFTAVPTPSAARPGDILLTPRHIRIVIRTKKGNGRLILHIAESTSEPDIPAGQTAEEPDIGPRRLQVCYPAPQRHIREQQPTRKRRHDPAFQFEAEETMYVIGRTRR